MYVDFVRLTPTSKNHTQAPVRAKLPSLRIVLEHATTKEAVRRGTKKSISTIKLDGLVDKSTWSAQAGTCV